jgi:hypothetical protein
VLKIKKTTKRIHKILYIIIILIIIAAIAVVVKDHFFKEKPKVASNPAIIKSLPAQSNPNRSKGPSSDNGVTQGSSTSSTSTTNIPSSTSQWTVSQSGNITLQEPLNNATISSGAPISGTSNTSSVDYTLIDNQAGVISQGTIPVVNGNFSGNMNFTSYSSSGRLDIYSTEANGKEDNLIEIQVEF